MVKNDARVPGGRFEEELLYLPRKKKNYRQRDLKKKWKKIIWRYDDDGIMETHPDKLRYNTTRAMQQNVKCITNNTFATTTIL